MRWSASFQEHCFCGRAGLITANQQVVSQGHTAVILALCSDNILFFMGFGSAVGGEAVVPCSLTSSSMFTSISFLCLFYFYVNRLEQRGPNIGTTEVEGHMLRESWLVQSLRLSFRSQNVNALLLFKNSAKLV
jgi:hypothetical protein